jgi:hypothetical protein
MNTEKKEKLNPEAMSRLEKDYVRDSEKLSDLFRESLEDRDATNLILMGGMWNGLKPGYRKPEFEMLIKRLYSLAGDVEVHTARYHEKIGETSAYLDHICSAASCYVYAENLSTAFELLSELSRYNSAENPVKLVLDLITKQYYGIKLIDN